MRGEEGGWGGGGWGVGVVYFIICTGIGAPLLFASNTLSFPSHGVSRLGPGVSRKPDIVLHALNKGAIKAAYPRSLISAFVIRSGVNFKWASTRENLSTVVCEQQRRRQACASAQTDQHLCYSLFGKYHI